MLKGFETKDFNGHFRSKFHRVLWGFSPNRHDIAEVLLKVALNTIPPQFDQKESEIQKLI
jgi:hypothetical protein